MTSGGAWPEPVAARKTGSERARAARMAAKTERLELELCRLTDDVIDGYVTWREQCVAVAATYADWQQATPSDEAAAFAAYLAVLDEEEQAATQYQRLLELMASRLRG